MSVCARTKIVYLSAGMYVCVREPASLDSVFTNTDFFIQTVCTLLSLCPLEDFWKLLSFSFVKLFFFPSVSLSASPSVHIYSCMYIYERIAQ